jgi:hypothetical protein
MSQIIALDAKRLQQFFFRYTFHNKSEQFIRNKLLKTVPEACNYKYDPYTWIAEVCSWHSTTKCLAAHLILRFCPGCQCKVTMEFYEQLKFLGKVQGLLLGWKEARARPPPIARHNDISLYSLLKCGKKGSPKKL